MSARTIEAVFRNGSFHPVEPVELVEETRVRVQLDDEPTADDEARRVFTGADLRKFIGCISQWPEDPLEYQHRLRAEWERDIVDPFAEPHGENGVPSGAAPR